MHLSLRGSAAAWMYAPGLTDHYACGAVPFPLL